MANKLIIAALLLLFSLIVAVIAGGLAAMSALQPWACLTTAAGAFVGTAGLGIAFWRVLK